MAEPGLDCRTEKRVWGKTKRARYHEAANVVGVEKTVRVLPFTYPEGGMPWTVVWTARPLWGEGGLGSVWCAGGRKRRGFFVAVPLPLELFRFSLSSQTVVVVVIVGA